MVRDLTITEVGDLGVPVVMTLAGVLLYQISTGRQTPFIVQYMSVVFALVFLGLMIIVWLKYDKTPVAIILEKVEGRT
jgi:hypothetical protein